MHYEGLTAFHSTYYSEDREYLDGQERNQFKALGKQIFIDFKDQKSSIFACNVKRSLEVSKILQETLSLKSNQVRKVNGFFSLPQYQFKQDIIITRDIRKIDRNIDMAILITDVKSLRLVSNRDDNDFSMNVLPAHAVSYEFEGNWEDFSFEKKHLKSKLIKEYTPDN